MKVRVKRLDKGYELPKYETSGSVGFDFMARGDFEIAAGEIALIPSNLIVEVPEGYMLVIASRSSTPLKKGLTPPHGFGIIDHDYCGPKDEVKLMVRNFSDEVVKINDGDKIAQGVFVRVDTFEFEECDVLAERSRGGIGSTGGYVKDKIQTNG